MLKSDFYYDLPEERIAQTPVEPRDSSRMMVFDKTTETKEEFYARVAKTLKEAGVDASVLELKAFRVLIAQQSFYQ